MDKEQVKEKINELSIKDWIIIILFLIILLLSFGLSIYFHKYHDAEKEIVIWNDSTYVYKNKLNEEYIAKNTYILKAAQLEAYNKELYEEYKQLKDNPVVITKTEVITKIDTVRTEVAISEMDSNKIKWEWQANDKDYYTIAGVSGIENIDDSANIKPYTTINTAQINTALTMDVIDDGKQLSVVAKTDNPYVSLTNMQSVVIDPMKSPTIKNMYKPKRWGFGPTISGGLYGGYDFVSGKPSIGGGIMVGFSIHYDIVQW